MNKGKQIKSTIAALILLSVFMVPAVVQFFHSFQDEDHVVCSEKTVHVHEAVPDCPICHFHLATISFDVAEYPELVQVVIPTTVYNFLSSPQPRFFQRTAIQLRAPPKPRC